MRLEAAARADPSQPFHDDTAIGRAFEAMLGCRLIRWALVPSASLFQGRKLGDRDALRRRAFEHFLAPIGGEEPHGQALEERFHGFRVSIELRLIEGALANEDHISRHSFLHKTSPGRPGDFSYRARMFPTQMQVHSLAQSS